MEGDYFFNTKLKTGANLEQVTYQLLLFIWSEAALRCRRCIDGSSHYTQLETRGNRWEASWDSSCIELRSHKMLSQVIPGGTEWQRVNLLTASRGAVERPVCKCMKPKRTKLQCKQYLRKLQATVWSSLYHTTSEKRGKSSQARFHTSFLRFNSEAVNVRCATLKKL